MFTRRSIRAVAGASGTSIDSVANSPQLAGAKISTGSSQVDSPALATRSKKTIYADLQTLSQTLETVPQRKRRLTESPIPQNKLKAVSTKDGPNSDDKKRPAAQNMGAMLSKESKTPAEDHSSQSDHSNSEQEEAVSTSSHFVDDKKAAMTRRTRLQDKGTAKKIEFSSEESDEETQINVSRPRRILRAVVAEKSTDKKVEESSDDSKKSRPQRSVKPQLATVTEETDKAETTIMRRSLSLKHNKSSNLKAEGKPKKSCSSDDSDVEDFMKITRRTLKLLTYEQDKLAASSSDDTKNKHSQVPKQRSARAERNSERESSDSLEIELQKKETPMKSDTPSKTSPRKQVSSTPTQDIGSENASIDVTKKTKVTPSKQATSANIQSQDSDSSSEYADENCIEESTDLEESDSAMQAIAVEKNTPNQLSFPLEVEDSEEVSSDDKYTPKKVLRQAICSEDEKMECDKSDSGDSQGQDNTPFFDRLALVSSDSEDMSLSATAAKDQQEEVDFFANNSDISTEAYVEDDSGEEAVKSSLKQSNVSQAPKEFIKETTPKLDDNGTYLRVDLLKDPNLDKVAQEIATQKSPEEFSAEKILKQIKSPSSEKRSVSFTPTKSPSNPENSEIVAPSSTFRVTDTMKSPTPKKKLFVSLASETRSPTSENVEYLSPSKIDDKLPSPQRSPVNSLQTIASKSLLFLSPIKVAEKIKSPSPDRTFSTLLTPAKIKDQSKTPTPSKVSSVIKSSPALPLKSPPTTPTKPVPNELSQERKRLENVQSKENTDAIFQSPKLQFKFADSVKNPTSPSKRNAGSESINLPSPSTPPKTNTSVSHFNLKLSNTTEKLTNKNSVSASNVALKEKQNEIKKSPQKSLLEGKIQEKKKKVIQLASSSDSENVSDSSSDSEPEEITYIKKSMSKQKSLLSNKSESLRKVETFNNLNKNSKSPQSGKNAQKIESENQKTSKNNKVNSSIKKAYSAVDNSGGVAVVEEQQNVSVSSNKSKMWATIRKQRQEKLNKQLKAMRNWQVTVMEPESEEDDHTEILRKIQVAAEKPKKKHKNKQSLQCGARQYIETSSEDEQREEEVSPPKKKRSKKIKAKEFQNSELQKKSPKLQPLSVTIDSNDDDDAPEELTFDAGKSSAFEVFNHIAQARKQEKEKKRDKQRKKQERLQAERDQKQQKAKQKSSLQESNGYSVDDSIKKSKKKKMSQEGNDEVKVPAKLPLNILEKLSAQPELTQANSDLLEARKKKKKKKRDHKIGSQIDVPNNEPEEKKSKKDYIPISSAGSTQFGIAPLNVVPSSILAPASKLTAWRDNRFHGKKVKRHSMSEIKAIEQKKKYKSSFFQFKK